MNEPYIKINAILSSVLVGIFIYSYFIPSLIDHGMTVPSSCEGMPEVYCKSRGLTRAFAAIMHGEIEGARKLNTYSLSIFVFFVVEFAARIFLSVIYLWRKNMLIIYSDAVMSAGYFLIVFSPLTMTS